MNIGCGQHWFSVDRTMCVCVCVGGVYAFCSKEKEGYLPFSFPINCISLGFFCFGVVFFGGGEEVCYPHGLFNSRIHSVCLDLDYCPSVFDERSLRPQANERRGKTGSNGMSD